MGGWRWEDPRWREWMQNDSSKPLLEALRRAVDIRDRNAEGAALSVRPTLLVDVLNELCRVMDISEFDLWDGTDLWDGARSAEHDDESAFWRRRVESE